MKSYIEKEEIFNDDRSQVGFLSFDSNLHFYSFDKSFKVVVCNENPFPHSLLFNVCDKKEAILSLLDNFDLLWNKNTSNGSVFYKALEMSISLMKNTGGKLIVM